MLFIPDRNVVPVKIKPPIAPHFKEDWKGFLNHYFEVIYLGKNDYSGYKNQVSGNARIIAAFQVTTLTAAPLVLILLFFIKSFGSLSPSPKESLAIIVTLILTYCGTVGGIFLKEKNSLYEKWKYLAGVYNEVLKADPAEKTTDYKKRDLLEVALALDLLEMEMWSHNSFAETFKITLINAIMHTSYGDLKSKEWLIKRISTEGISLNNAYVLLESYHSQLFKNQAS